MIISIINHTNGKVSDEEMHCVIRAINRQVKVDFEPYWSMGAAIRLEGRSTDKPEKESPPDMRGDAVLYVWDKSDIAGAIGYHNLNHRGIPFGFVFLDIAQRVGESWTVTLSHEVLETIADPMVNLLAMGPHPAQRERTVFHWYEMCDAVQAESYEIDGVEVSNFVLPCTSPTATRRAAATTSWAAPMRARRSSRSASIPGATSASSIPRPASMKPSRWPRTRKRNVV